MVSSSCMGEGFKLESEVDMELLSEEEVCCSLGEHEGELGHSDDSLSSRSRSRSSLWVGCLMDL